jgi:hypothetical protein
MKLKSLISVFEGLDHVLTADSSSRILNLPKD